MISKYLVFQNQLKFIINANKMESDIVLRALMKVGYPWIYRHDRRVYEKYTKIDPLELMKNCIIASSIGYLVGKLMKRREKVYSTLFCIPIIFKYIWDQWSIKDSLKNYSSFKVQVSQQARIRKQKRYVNEKQKQSINQSKRFQITRKIPKLQNKIYCASDFINQLNDSYFQ